MPKKLISLREANLKKAKRYQGAVCLDVCGGITPYLPEYNNVDIVKGDFVFDVSKGIPFPDCSIDHLVSIATLEHFNYTEFLFVLAEMVRVLKVGGKISISTPDVEKISRFVLEKGFIDNHSEINQNLYALQRDPYDIHKVALSGRFVLSLLKDAGFGDFVEDDESFHIRHSIELSSRVSAIKKTIVPKIDWLSVYRHQGNQLALAQNDRVRVSADHEEIALYLPSVFNLLDQKVDVFVFDKRLTRMDVLTDDSVRIDLPPVPGLKYYDLRFKFLKKVRPADVGIGSDERELGGFLVWDWMRIPGR